MKKTLPIPIICLLAILLFTNAKQKSTTSTSASADASMSFKVNGVLTTMSDEYAQIKTTPVGSGVVNVIRITGETKPGNYPGITMQVQSQAPGTFTFNTGNGTATMVNYMEGAGSQNIYAPTSGQVTITSLTSTNVAGTFQFTGRSAGGAANMTRVITEGAFNCPIRPQ